jgi:hypothetical protein
MGAIGPSAHSVSRQFEMTYWRDSHFGQSALDPVVAVAVAVGGARTCRLPAHPLPVYSGRVDRAR